MKRKLTVDELTRLAFIWAEQDRESLAESWPPGSEERADAESDATALRRYRLKRWGRTRLEEVLSDGTFVDPLTLKSAKEAK